MTMLKQIEQNLKEELGRFVESHPYVAFRFEYSEEDRLFLVSYHFNVDVDDEHSVWDDIYRVEIFFNDNYHDDAPLFCQDNRLFTLSPSAQTIVPVQPVRQTSVRVPVAAQAGHPNTIRI